MWPSLEGAHSTEIDPDTRHPVIALVSEWVDRTGKTEHRDGDEDLGGTMRLGEQRCLLARTSLSRALYGADSIMERHRHRYEVNNDLRRRAGEARSGGGGAQRRGRSRGDDRTAHGRLVRGLPVPPGVQFIPPGQPPAVPRLHRGGQQACGSGQRPPKSRQADAYRPPVVVCPPGSHRKGVRIAALHLRGGT